MKQISACIIISALRVFNPPAHIQQTNAAFASETLLQSVTIPAPARFIHFTAHLDNSKVLLEWTVNENQTANKFEVEKSTDGKNYRTAALVFGTDSPASDVYRFYEKAEKQKMIYRIKMINKNDETEFSTPIEIKPNS
jgi:hypothetical protein